MLGDNGAGKTTLLRSLLGELPLLAGNRWVGPSTVFGQLPQGPGPFAGPATLLRTFASATGLGEGEGRGAMAKFGLGADDVHRAGDPLSPGERTRAGYAGAIVLVSHDRRFLDAFEATRTFDVSAYRAR